MADVERISDVLPVPILSGTIEPAPGSGRKASGSALEIVWNHRWEYDKQPEVFFAAMKLLQNRGVEFVLHVMGQSFREMPPCFAEAKQTFGDRIVTWGYQPRDAYLQILRQSDIVVSCAAHDFQGLGMLEAISEGCMPLAPARVAYVEYVPASLMYHCEVGDSREPDLLCEKIVSLLESEWPSIPDVSRYSATKLLEQYRQLFTETIDGVHSQASVRSL